MTAGAQMGGADGLRRLSVRARRFNASGVFPAAIEDALAGMAPEAREAVRGGTERLPERGGLARRVAQTRVAGQTFRRGDAIGIRLKAEANALKDPAAVNRGRVRRPTYGHRPWVIQIVKPGFFSEPLKDLQPEIRKRLGEARREAMRKF